MSDAYPFTAEPVGVCSCHACTCSGCYRCDPPEDVDDDQPDPELERRPT